MRNLYLEGVNEELNVAVRMGDLIVNCQIVYII